MIDSLSFLKNCEALTGGQTAAQIFHKAIVLIEDPIYWCGSHKACIRGHYRTEDGREYSWCSPCRINDPRATSVNIEGAVGRACNNEGIIPPFLLSYLDRAVLIYLRSIGATFVGSDAGVWNPYDVGWFGERYGHDHAMNLLHEIYGWVSNG
jgi:hypothetical protein